MTTRSFNSIAGFSVGDPRTEIILANGDIQTTNLTANGAVNFTSSANVSLGSISNVHISGGNDGYFLATDGSGNLSWTYANVQIGGAYVFTKTTPSNVWVVTHNLGEQYVNIQIIDANGNSVLGGFDQETVVTFNNANALTVTFTSAQTGWAAVTSGGGQVGPPGPGLTPAGSNTYIQYNDGSNLAASANFTFDSSYNSGGGLLQVGYTAGGAIETDGLTVGGVSNLGAIGNVKITGGAAGQYVFTDGAGNLSFGNVAGGNVAATMPTYIPVGESYYVPENFQGLFTVPIEIDGEFEVDGILAEVGTAINSLNSQVIFDDNGELTGNTGFTFDQTSGNLSVPGSGIFTGGLLPSANITYDLGSPTQRWKDLYLSNNTIYLGNSTISTDGANVVITNAEGGSLDISGNGTANTTAITNGTSNLIVNATTINFGVDGNANVFKLTGTGANITGTLNATGNAAVSGILTDNYFYANGSPLDVGGNPGGSNTQIQFNNNGEFSASANLTFDSATNNLAVTGNISTTNLSVTGNGVITGNLLVNGNLIYINVEELSVQDPIITLNTGANGVPPVANTGTDVGTALYYYDTQARTAFMGWDTSNSEFAFGSQTSISSEVVTFNTLGNVRAQTFIGNVQATTISGNLTTASQSNITTVGTLGSLSVTGNITAGNIDGGNVINANYLISDSGCVTLGTGVIGVSGTAGGVFASTITDINFGLAANIVMGSSSGNVTVQGNLTANGAVTGTTLTGTLTTAAQPNITSTGTLTNLSVTGNINTGNITVTNTVDAVNIKVTDLFSKRTSINIGTQTPIDTFPISSFRSAKYTMRAGDGTDYQALEVLLVHNNINSIITVYGSLSTSGTDLVVFDTDISAGNVNVYATAVGPGTNLNLMGTYVPD